MRAVLLPNQPLILAQTKAARSTSSDAARNNSESARPNLSEIEAVVTQQWNDWRKFFQALPQDSTTDDVSSSPTLVGSALLNATKKASTANTKGDGSPTKEPKDNNLPKMVLVEIDGVQMFYPSCFVGILADELISNSSTDKNEHGCSGMEASSSITLSTNVGFSAEDHEVEEILSSSFNGTLPRRTPVKRNLAGNRYGKNI